MKDKEPIDEVYIVLEKDHREGVVLCSICRAPTTLAYHPRGVASNFINQLMLNHC